jgi:hypothetical protein
MPVDERARHQLYRKLEEVLGGEEAGTLMDHLPPAGFADLATKEDLLLTKAELKAEMGNLRRELTAEIAGLRAEMESLARRLIMWTSTMVLATGGLSFAAGRFV